MRYRFENLQSNSSTSSEISSTTGIGSEISSGSGLDSVNLISSSASSTDIEAVEPVKTCVGLAGAVPENYKSNWDNWNEVDELDWLQITPDYAQGPGELRSRASVKILSIADGSAITSFPTDFSGEVGNPVTAVSLVNTNNVLTFLSSGNSIIPTHTNVETLYPGFLIGYQTDLVSGPSEKILVNIRRLRSLKIKKVQIRYGGFWIINKNLGIIPLKIKQVSAKGGFAFVIDIGGTEPGHEDHPYRNWDFSPPFKLLLDNETMVNATVNSNSSASPDYWLTIEVDLVKRTLHYIY